MITNKIIVHLKDGYSFPINGYVQYANSKNGLKIVCSLMRCSFVSPEMYSHYEIEGGKPFYYRLVAKYATTYINFKRKMILNKYEHNRNT
jgi:hypothetical protein